MRRRHALGVLAVLSLAGCAVGPNYRPPTDDAPTAFASAPDADPSTAPHDAELARWWTRLHDPELDSLVERAVRNNPDVLIALAHLQQAQTFEAVVLGRALPTVDATGAAARGTGSDLARGRAGQALVSADSSSGLEHINTLGGFDALWELDLFGKYRREFEAARANGEAARAARNGVLVSVVASVARGYCDLRGLQSRAAILRKEIDLLSASAELVTQRYERGITNELDVTLASRELANKRADLAPVDAAVSAAQYALAALIGEYPEAIVAELSTPAPIPTLPDAIASGTPLEVLRRRPDVREAERELASATAGIGVATANLFPHVALVGSIGAQAQGLGTSPAVGRHIWSFGPGASWPLLDFGALDAAVEIASLDARVSLLSYRRTVIAAVEEVDATLAAYRAERARLASLGDGLVAAERAVALANARYDRGLTEFLSVIDAERQLYVLEEQYVLAETASADEVVALYKGLGGGWQGFEATPPPRAPLPAVAASLRELFNPSSP